MFSMNWNWCSHCNVRKRPRRPIQPSLVLRGREPMYSEKIDAKTIGISKLVAVPSGELEEMSRQLEEMSWQTVMEFYTPKTSETA